MDFFRKIILACPKGDRTVGDVACRVILHALPNGCKQQKGKLLLVGSIGKSPTLVGIGEKAALDEHGRAVKVIEQIDLRAGTLDAAVVVGLKLLAHA